MVLCVKTPLKKTELVKRFIVDNDIIDHSFLLKKNKSCIFFPIRSEGRAKIKKEFVFVDFCEKDLCKRKTRTGFKDSVKESISDEEREFLRRSFDVIGSIAILEIPPELVKREKIIARKLLEVQKNVKTVLKKAGSHETDYRTQNMKFLAGVNTKETVHREYGVQLKLDVEKVYFSPRLSTERKRIADQIAPGESVLVMFSGCAPYPCVISKNTKAKEVYGIELNPVGHKYGLENLKLNRIRNVFLLNEDVTKAVPELGKKFDRIVMPLPKSAGDFLSTAFKAAKKGTVIHFYSFEEESHFDSAHDRIIKECKRNNVKCRILRTVKCGQHAPRIFRICVDFRIS